MAFRVVPIAEEHIEGFWSALDSVARERRYEGIQRNAIRVDDAYESLICMGLIL